MAFLFSSPAFIVHFLITSLSSAHKQVHNLAQGSKPVEAEPVCVWKFKCFQSHPFCNFTLVSLQDSLSGGFDSSQALVGELSQVGLWDRVLSSNQVASLARCGRVTQGCVAPWTENGVEVYGGATKDPGEPCSKHNRSSQWLMGEGEVKERKGEGREGKVVALSRR